MKTIKNFDGEYAFLSNFYPSPFTINGITYQTNEHYFQSQKTLGEEEKQEIINAPTPGFAKNLGRNCTLRDDWELNKNRVMYKGLVAKFTENPDLTKKLLATKDAYLIEGNLWHDNIWGDCQCYMCRHKTGENRLGQMLMAIRDKFKTGEYQTK